MSVYNQAAAYRRAVLGEVSNKTTTITADTTYQLFTVSGGDVLVTALYGRVTTAITDAGEDLLLQVDPTSGATASISQNSGDIGTSDTAAGSLLTAQFDQDGTTNTPLLVVGPYEPFSFVCPTGEIELVVGTGSGAEDGVITWYATWVPLQDGATLVASA